MNSLPHYGGRNQQPSANTPLNDDDSGQGSSLDRDYGIYNNTSNDHRYANPPMQYTSMDHNEIINGNNGFSGSPNQQHRYSNGNHYAQQPFDLTNNREFRGSAFEVYKKPLSTQNTGASSSDHSSPGHYQNSIW